MKTAPTAQPVSYITGEVMDKIEGSAAWEDDLGGVDVEAVEDINLKGVQRESLRAICEYVHVLPPAPLQPLPESRMCSKLPIGLHIQARRGRHRLGRSG